jgi:hypothetical protein
VRLGWVGLGKTPHWKNIPIQSPSIQCDVFVIADLLWPKNERPFRDQVLQWGWSQWYPLVNATNNVPFKGAHYKVYCGGDALFDLVTYTTITTSFSKPQLSLDSFMEEDMMKILSQLCQWQISYTLGSI